MKVLVIGGTLFIGRALVAELARAGHEVTVLHRRAQHDLAAAGGSRARKRVRQRRRETSAEVVAGNRVATKKAAVSPRRRFGSPYGRFCTNR